MNRPCPLPPYVVPHDGSCELLLYLSPRSSRTKFAGEHAGKLKLSVSAAPVDGKANEALIAYISEFFSVPKSAVRITSGLASKNKRVVLAGVPAEAAARRLMEL